MPAWRSAPSDGTNLLDEGGGAALPHRDDTSFQTSEIQPGFNFSFAAQLEEWGVGEQADILRRVLHAQLERCNLTFQTPAAYDRCRAVLNMRPLAVWWMR